jgi:hypothetical protein
MEVGKGGEESGGKGGGQSAYQNQRKELKKFSDRNL